MDLIQSGLKKLSHKELMQIAGGGSTPTGIEAATTGNDSAKAIFSLAGLETQERSVDDPDIQAMRKFTTDAIESVGNFFTGLFN